MRLILIITFSIFTSVTWGQELYHSPYSIHRNSGIIEKISRDIEIKGDTIRIESNAGNGIIDIQTMVIFFKEETYDDYTSFRIYHCVSEDGWFPTTIIIEEKPTYITLIQPHLSFERQDEFRLVLEQYN